MSYKWFLCTFTNCFLSVLKDRAFAKIFGTKAPGKMPLGTYGAWIARDGVAIAFNITFPPIFALSIEKMGLNENLSMKIS